MIYGSVCSGIEAATVAWHPLGWRPSFFSEIEKFPREVLAHHYPHVSLHGDFTTIQKGQYDPIELLVGGTPCQSFSNAGLRAGLDDPRGNLMLEFGALARRLRPRWMVWENVPGVLSSNDGRDFGTFLGMLGELGYGFSYRVLDAQYFGVAQARRRVFVIGYLGDWRRSAAVLFERDSFKGDAPDKIQKFSGSNISAAFDIGMPESTRREIQSRFAIRNLTPIEYERAQGFPDNYTNIPGASDSPRYKALGNSMAVPVMRWIGSRIAQVDAIKSPLSEVAA